LKGAILIISGPSGSGKSSLLKKLFEEFDDLYFSISTTTREMRDGEVEGEDYYFISKEQFKDDINNGNFLEWAKVHDNYYGTSLKPIIKALKDGKLVIFDIDVQGQKIVKEKFSNLMTSVFLTTPSMQVLKQRLVNRGTDSPEIIEKRLKNALNEITCIYEFDYLLINDDFDTTYNILKSIVIASKHKATLKDMDNFILEWAG
jgi:guanylate kinase